jgi:hypothetical protein
MTETTLHHPPESQENAAPERARAWSFVAVATVIVVGLSLMLGLAVLLSRLLGNPPA